MICVLVESGPGINLSNVKGNLMKKAKLEYLNR